MAGSGAGRAVYAQETETEETIPEGMEELTFDDGSRYVGEVENGQPNGTGTMYWPEDDAEGKDHYTGYFKDGARNGYGEMYWRNGNRYEDDWTNDIIGGGYRYILLGKRGSI